MNEKYMVYETSNDMRHDRRPLTEGDVWTVPEHTSDWSLQRDPFTIPVIPPLERKRRTRSIVKVGLNGITKHGEAVLPGDEIVIKNVTYIPSPMAFVPKFMVGRGPLKEKMLGVFVYEGELKNKA